MREDEHLKGRRIKRRRSSGQDGLVVTMGGNWQPGSESGRGTGVISCAS